MLLGVCQYFQYCIALRQRQSVPSKLIHSIDAAAAQVTRCNIAETESDAPATPDRTLGEKSLRDTLHALTGMRLSLHPPATESLADSHGNGPAPRQKPA